MFELVDEDLPKSSHYPGTSQLHRSLNNSYQHSYLFKLASSEKPLKYLSLTVKNIPHQTQLSTPSYSLFCCYFYFFLALLDYIFILWIKNNYVLSITQRIIVYNKYQIAKLSNLGKISEFFWCSVFLLEDRSHFSKAFKFIITVN